MSTKSIKIKSAIGRTLMVIAALFCVFAAIYVFVWMFADAIADNAQEKNVAEFAAGLAPHNPQAHYSLGVLQEDSFIPEDIPKSLAEFEKAVALSPNDYRLWLALGKARERSGDNKGAELAMQKALELAPNYSEVQWAYGNILLRQGKNKQAFEQIGKAVTGNPDLAGPAVNTAWQIFDGDVDKIKQMIGNSTHTRAAFATFFVAQKKYDEAINFWNSIPLEEKKKTFKDKGELLFNSLIDAKKYRSAFRVRSQISENSFKDVSIEKISNGGFEGNITETAPTFEWQIETGNQPQIGIDNQQKHSGSRSLVLAFGGVDNRTFRGVSQTVLVEGGKEYDLQLFYKSDLETTAKFVWEVVDTISNEVIAKSEEISEKTDWKSLNINFKTSEETEGIIIRLVRSECASKLCPTSGRLWFDDFLLN